MAKENEITLIDFETNSKLIKFEEILRRIDETIKLLNKFEFIDIHLWKTLREKFENCTKNYFDTINKTKMRLFKLIIRKQNVWVKLKRISTAKVIANMLKKTQWLSKKIHLQKVIEMCD